MPEGPRGEKRAADDVPRAATIGRTVAGEVEDARDRIARAAAELGRRGGKARAEKMTPERRAEIARKAAAKRWAARD